MDNLGVYIDRIKLFDGLSQAGKEALVSLCQLKPLKKKAYLFHEGDRGSAIYFLVQGNIQLHKTSQDGREVVIKVVQPGEVFAEVILFEQSNYPVTAMAIAESLVLSLAKQGFAELLNRAEFREDFLANLMRKLRYLSDRIQYLSSCDIEERFRAFLREHYGEQQRITCQLSKKDIAAAVAATPESLSRLIFRLRKDGRLKWDGDTIELSDEFWHSPDDFE